MVTNSFGHLLTKHLNNDIHNNNADSYELLHQELSFLIIPVAEAKS
jgi:hypothetical protein